MVPPLEISYATSQASPCTNDDRRWGRGDRKQRQRTSVGIGAARRPPDRAGGRPSARWTGRGVPVHNLACGHRPRDPRLRRQAQSVEDVDRRSVLQSPRPSRLAARLRPPALTSARRVEPDLDRLRPDSREAALLARGPQPVWHGLPAQPSRSRLPRRGVAGPFPHKAAEILAPPPRSSSVLDLAASARTA